MVVLYVASNHETTMLRTFLFSGFSRVLRAGFAGAVVLATAIACFDNATAPSSVKAGSEALSPDEIQFAVADALKNPPGLAASRLSQPAGVNVLRAPVYGSMDGVVDPNAYSVFPVAFSPEPAPLDSLGPKSDDGVIVNKPIGFAFTFYGVSYTVLNIGSNGFVSFGTARSNGCCAGDQIPLSTDLMNNMIAVAWTDWNAGTSAPGAIKYATTGVAPNRKFVVQWTAVNENISTGSLTAQLVLSEGSNDITIYTTLMRVDYGLHLVTQGIENATGTIAAWAPGRVRNLFTLQNDAIRFSLSHPNEAPSITAPSNFVVNTGAASCAATVDVGVATAVDDNPGVVVSGKRSDGEPLDGEYPKGLTTIVWTATDAGGLTVSANQSITVNDSEKPLVGASADITAPTDPGLPTANVSIVQGTASDNCPGVALSSARSDGNALSSPYPVGVTSITWSARDASGNVTSVVQSVTVRDLELPVIVVPSNFSVNADNAAGAIVAFALSATDNVGVVALSCNHNSGTQFPVGQTVVNCEASDAAGHRVTGSFVVSVISWRDQLSNLIQYVISLHLVSDTSDPLVSQLQNAFNANQDGTMCKKMSDFLHLVDVKAPTIPQDNANYMVSEAKRIALGMGCADAAINAVKKGKSPKTTRVTGYIEKR